MQKTQLKQSPVLKPATHLSHVLAWRGTPDRFNFGYAQGATITWSAVKGVWEFNSYLNGEKARVSYIEKGDFVWEANTPPNYFKVVNASNTIGHMRSLYAEDGKVSKWDGEKLVPSTLAELLKGTER